ncbi:MAG: hypothetical protein LRZ84_23935 [Desertifilum sp.]|nr:hypothetical protein [Desertifilum sp.]
MANWTPFRKRSLNLPFFPLQDTLRDRLGFSVFLGGEVVVAASLAVGQ